MQYLGVNYEMKHAPKLDPTFIPFGVWRAAYLEGAQKPIAIAVERQEGITCAVTDGTDYMCTRNNLPSIDLQTGNMAIGG